MNRRRAKLLAWTSAAVAALSLCIAALVWLTMPCDYPDEARAQRDFLAEHPPFVVERIAVDEQEVVAVCFRIFYRVPEDSALREEFRQYLYSDGEWLISHRIAQR